MGILSDQLKREVKGKVSQFILSEAGRVGYRNAFSMAALVTASSLAAMMLGYERTSADDVVCDECACPHPVGYCCIVPDQRCFDGIRYVFLEKEPLPGQPCWWVPQC